ncbi:phytanoyl-CoA dioxygenase family protein [Acidisphaera sp. L21]|uniref:phytanoyl-CoA dioxygenase family protein n=1 Tax=Acidisphaera sp. L21 TaxID=1641851 RepID=UPI00131DEDF8|nr:phytanoyl-CoA dioxygenase family protein [Acidisphaera sp. L21]
MVNTLAKMPVYPAADATIDRPLRERGWVLVPDIVPQADLPGLRAAIHDSIADCGRRQVESGATTAPDGTAHHTVGQYPAFDAFLERRYLCDVATRYFGDAAFILHAFNPVCVQPAGKSYLHQIHRDVRTHGGDFRFMLNVLVMVDPFTLENGATHVLSGSHHSATPPVDAAFWADAERLTGPAGSIVLFDSNLWHAAGHNGSDAPRAALTLSYSRGFVKQQMDYPRFLGPKYGQAASPAMRQLLGYDAMVPTSYGEFYRPRETRLYKGNQG